MKFKQHGKRPDWRALLAVWLTLAFLTAAGFAAYSAWQTSRIGFAVHFVDVGQGDGAIVVCDGKTLVIDGGTAENGAKMVEYLQNTLHVSKVDFVIGTHPHADHIGGLPDVIRACKVKKLYSPVDEFEAKPFETMKRAADDKKLKITVPQAGQSFSLGRAKVEFLAPLGIYDNVNDLSLVVRVTYGQTAFLFTGDAERPSEYDMTDSGEDLSATVLKVGHHGSNTSTSYIFLRQVMPAYAIISCGKDNAYGHPHEEVLSRLADEGAGVYRTDECGTIVCRSNGAKVTVRTEKGKKWTWPLDLFR
ncbi:MAG: ComEC/Rec2 family competence protein [Christensenellales bacterium]